MKMKGFFSVFMAFMLIASVFITAKATDIDIDVSEGSLKTLTVSQMDGKYKTEGRTSIIGGNLSLDYTASGLEFNAYCVGDVSVTFNVSSITSGDSGGLYFTILVDDTVISRNASLITATGDSTLIIARGLIEGNHNFKIYRSTEIERATVAFKSVTLQGDLTAKPAEKALFVEFIGDAITTGSGILATSAVTETSSPAASSPVYQDGTKTYAFLTAKSLNADFSMVAEQNIGACYGTQTYNMITAYPCTRYSKDTGTQWDFAKQPDIVVINLGTNDINTYASKGKTLADVKTGFASLLALVRQKNPNAKIVWVHGMTTTTADATISQVISEAGGAAVNYYHVGLTTNTSGGNGYPNAAGQQAAATDLTSFIRSNVLQVSGHTPGDINGDTKVDLLDVTLLSRYVAGWQGVNVMNEALDVSGNSTVDLLDVTLLSRYVAGWNVTIY